MILSLIRQLYVYLRARKIRRRGKTLRLKIANIAEFFQALNDENISYVVLRWFDAVPLTSEAELAYSEDIDLFVDDNEIEAILKISSRFLGTISCDLYSKSGRMSTTFKKYPYFPPSFGDEILLKRIKYKNILYIPTPEIHFKTLAFHVVYQKGLISGLDTGIKGIKNKNLSIPKYSATLNKLATQIGLKLPKKLTLLALYNSLKDNNWAMPYDLLNRWPIRDQWIEWLTKHEQKDLNQIDYKNKQDLVVFVIREDAKDPIILNRVIELLKTYYLISFTKHLSDYEVSEMTRKTRGGNWLEHGKKDLIKPSILIACKKIKANTLNSNKGKSFDLIYKEEIRKIINLEYPDILPRLVLHSSDDYLEGLSYIKLLEKNG